jgi:hypothetical protein
VHIAKRALFNVLELAKGEYFPSELIRLRFSSSADFIAGLGTKTILARFSVRNVFGAF